MARERWLADGYDLTLGKGIRDVGTREGLAASPAISATDVTVAQRDGVLWAPGRLGEGGFTLSFWLGATTHAQAELDWEQLLRVLVKKHRLVHWVHQRVDGTVRECFGRVVGRINPTPIGQQGYKAQIEVTIPSGKWQSTTDADTDFMPFVRGGSRVKAEGWFDPNPGKPLEEDQIPEVGPYGSRLLDYAGRPEKKLLSAASSTFEGGSIGQWRGSTNAVVSATNQISHSGAWSLQVDAPAAGDSSVHSLSPAAGAIPVSAGFDYTFAAWVRVPARARQHRVSILWFNSSSALIGQTHSGVTDAGGAAWRRLQVLGTAPAGAVTCRPTVTVLSQVANEGFQVDDAYLIQGRYFNAYYENGWEFHPEDHVFVQTALTAGAVDRLISLPGFAGASAPMTSLRFDIVGPITGLRVTNPETGAWFTYDRPLLTGESLYVNTRDDYVTAPMVDAFRYSGPYMMEVTPPDDPTVAPTLRIQASEAGLGARFRVRGRRQYQT